MKRATLALMLLVLLIPANLASANDHVETVVTFDPASGEFPEGIAADHRGNLYVSLAPLGQIWQLAPDGSSRLFASLVDPASLPLPLGALGIAVDPTGDVYVALASFDPTSHGFGASPEMAPISNACPGRSRSCCPTASRLTSIAISM
jgi:hypothetical protein